MNIKIFLLVLVVACAVGTVHSYPNGEKTEITNSDTGDDTGSDPGDDTGSDPGDGTGSDPGDGTGSDPGDGTGDTTTVDPTTPNATDNPTTPTATDNPTTPNATDNPTTPTATDNPTTPTATDNPTTPTATDDPTTPNATDNPTTPNATDNPTTPTATDDPTTPNATDNPTTPTATDDPTTPNATDNPTTPNATDNPTTPTATDDPTPPNATDDPTTPTATDDPTTPNATDDPTTPNATEDPTTPTTVDPNIPDIIITDDDDKPCILASIDLSLDVKYTRFNNVSSNATFAVRMDSLKGACTNRTIIVEGTTYKGPVLISSWKWPTSRSKRAAEPQNTVVIQFKEEGTSTTLDTISALISLKNSALFVNATNPDDFAKLNSSIGFSTDKNTRFTCYVNKSFDSEDGSVILSSVNIEVGSGSENGEFSEVGNTCNTGSISIAISLLSALILSTIVTIF